MQHLSLTSALVVGNVCLEMKNFKNCFNSAAGGQDAKGYKIEG
jgi:hypothetical protein